MFGYKWFFLNIFILSVNISFAQVEWSCKSKINWGNFKGIPSSDTLTLSASTYSWVECGFGYSNACFYYEVRTFFDEEKSWSFNSTSNLLGHERTHFDISEIYARMIRKYLKRQLLKGISEKQIQEGIDSLQKAKNNYQDLYDKETNHSLNIEKQKQWEMKIKTQLKLLELYHTPEYDNCK